MAAGCYGIPSQGLMKTVLSQNNQLPKQRDTGMRGGVAAWEHAIYAAKEYKRMLLSGNMGW